MSHQAIIQKQKKRINKDGKHRGKKALSNNNEGDEDDDDENDGEREREKVAIKR